MGTYPINWSLYRTMLYDSKTLFLSLLDHKRGDYDENNSNKNNMMIMKFLISFHGHAL